MAMSNETAFAKVTTLLKGEDIQKYYEGLIDISNRTGVAFNDLAESMYSALSAGVAQESALEFVEKSIKLSKGGFTQTATAIDIVTTALNAYNMEISEAEHVQDVLITTQNLGKTTVDQLASSMGTLIPTANSVNVSFDQLGAMYSTLTASIGLTAESTTYLKAMLNELGSSGSTAEKAMMEATKGTDMAGKKFAEISAMGYDVTDVLSLMSDYAQSTGKSIGDMFSSSEAGNAAKTLLSNIQVFKDDIKAMENSAGAASDAAEIMMNTAAEKVQVAKNQIDNLVSAIGDSLLPVIGEAAEEVSEALDSGDIQNVSKNVGSFISGTLTLLLKNLDLILSTVTGITAAVIAFKTANMLTSVISSWQNAALQVKLFAAAEGSAALQTAATNGTLTLQEVIYAALSGKLDMATVKTYALNTAMSLNPAGAIATVVGLLATAITGYSIAASNAAGRTKDYSAALNEINQKQEDSVASGEAELKIIEQKVKRYEELRTQISRNADETAELEGLAGDLQKTFGDSVDVVDNLTGSYNSLTDAYNDYATAMRNNVLIEAKKNAAVSAQEQILEMQKELSELEKRESEQLIYGTTPDDFMYIKSQKKQLEDNIKEAQKIIDDYVNAGALYGNQDNFTVNTKSPSTGTTSSGDFINNDEQLQKFKAQQEWLKYEYDMGEISAEKYYSTLQSIRDKYLSYNIDSNEYRSVSLEIKKYYDNLSEEQKKAYEKMLEEQEKAAEEAETARKKAAEEAEAARKEAYNSERSQLEFQLKTKKISEKKYYEEIAKLRDKYLDKNSDEWRSAYLETYEYNQKILQANKDALSGLNTEMYQIGADVAKEFVSGWNEALGTKDLTVGELMRAVSGGTLDTAPRAAQQLTSKEAAAASSSVASAALGVVNLPIYFGSNKLADIIIDAANGKIIKNGKNVLLT